MLPQRPCRRTTRTRERDGCRCREGDEGRDGARGGTSNYVATFARRLATFPLAPLRSGGRRRARAGVGVFGGGGLGKAGRATGPDARLRLPFVLHVEEKFGKFGGDGGTRVVRLLLPRGQRNFTAPMCGMTWMHIAPMFIISWALDYRELGLALRSLIKKSYEITCNRCLVEFSTLSTSLETCSMQ
jgi:hypothetical protein